jgi:signal peptidase I
MPDPVYFLKQYFKANQDVYQLARDIVFSLSLVVVIALALYLYAGVWTPVVSVDGTSMLDHMHAGDLVLVQGLDRTTVHTYQASANASYRTFGEYGDVLVYFPYGDRSGPMVIHRAMYWVNQSEPMWPDGPEAPWPGYITRGDNNNGHLDQSTDICLLQPVKPEWIHGVAKYDVPFVGYLRSLI